MIRTNAKEARKNLSHLLDQVENGEEITILRRGHVIAHIVPHFEQATMKRLPELKQLRNSIKITGKPLSEMVKDERNEND